MKLYGIVSHGILKKIIKHAIQYNTRTKIKFILVFGFCSSVMWKFGLFAMANNDNT